MKTLRYFICLLIFLPLLSSCGFHEIQLPEVTDAPSETESDAEVLPSPTACYTVVFEENETFPSEAERKASERIDSAILTAVKLLNTVEEEAVPILDCSQVPNPAQRESLEHPLSKELYDQMLERISAFEDYHFSEKDYPGEDFFNIFINALDALQIDHTELFLYCDADIDATEYRSGYYMPGDGLNTPCDDRDAIRAEVDLCSAVVARILAKMPAGLSNYEKCCYFAFVLAAANEYDHSETTPTNAYQAYNAFVRGKAICSGYAQAFYVLCLESGISCRYCRGTTPEGPHAWNMLYTDEGVVYVDVTWYDTNEISEDYRDGKEQYLFMTQEDFDFHGYVQEYCQ